MQAMILASGGGHHGAFVALVAAHVVSAVVGSGAIALGGVYGGTARHLEKPGALGEARRFFATPNAAALAVLAVPFFGVAALIAGGRSSQLSRAWVAIALAVWLVIAGLLTAVVRPAEQRLRLLLATEVPPASRQSGDVLEGLDLPGVSDAARRLSWASAVCDVGFVVALGLMIWQP